MIAQTDSATPLYQKGCKITAGARAGPPPPSFELAKMLVLTRRASSRIIKPAAATAIQKAFKTHLTYKMQRVQATVTIRKAVRAKQERTRRAMLAAQIQSAAVTLQSAARRHQATRRRLALRSRVLPAVVHVQACIRGVAARRHLRAAHAAACSVQAAWRMVAAQVVGRRLAGATARLQAGGVLAKYPKGGLSHERRARHVWLSKDRKKLCWTEPAAKDARNSEADKSVSMLAVAAVSAGVKTALMKKMERRADTGARARPLDAACAFSLIGSDRVLDLYAPDEATRAQWLRDLRTLLVFAHHLDHKAAVGAIEAGMRRGSLAEPAAAAA